MGSRKPADVVVLLRGGQCLTEPGLGDVFYIVDSKGERTRFEDGLIAETKLVIKEGFQRSIRKQQDREKLLEELGPAPTRYIDLDKRCAELREHAARLEAELARRERRDKEDS